MGHSLSHEQSGAIISMTYKSNLRPKRRALVETNPNRVQVLVQDQCSAVDYQSIFAALILLGLSCLSAKMSSHTQQSGGGSREVTPLVVCKMGQATVQEIVNKTQDLFATLQSLQVPNGATVTVQSYKEKQDKLKDIVKGITTSFKSLRALYDRCNQIVASLEQNNPQDYIPFVGVPENWSDLISSGYKERAQHLGEEKKELIEKLQAKNRQLRQVMERLRQLVWDINTMMAMRHTHPS